jgi:phosphatidylserine decarboxylase
MSIGHSPDEPQFEPDLPKKEEHVTIEEKQEAKRRITGSLGLTPPGFTVSHLD